jgi:uncharacterized membrane protein
VADPKTTAKEQSQWVPPLAYLRELEQISPGSSKRVLDILQQEAEHRRRTEETIIHFRHEEMRREFDYARLGQVLGFAVTVLFLGSATWLGLENHPAVASCLGLSGIVTIVGKLIQGRAVKK